MVVVVKELPTTVRSDVLWWCVTIGYLLFLLLSLLLVMTCCSER
jgi:hypothetical protein